MTPDRRHALVWRTKVSLALAGLFGSVIIVKLFCEQVPLRPARLALAEEILPGLEPENGEPGVISTLEGVPLARSVVRNSICANPSGYSTDAEREYVATQLARLTGTAYHRLYPRLCMKERKFCYIARQVTPDVEDQVMSMRLPGVFVQPEYARVSAGSSASGPSVWTASRAPAGRTSTARAARSSAPARASPPPCPAAEWC
jgi:hypothetical protein